MIGFRRILSPFLIASMLWPYSPAFAQLPQKPIYVRGVPYTVTQERDSRGRVTKEIITSPDFSEINVDSDGDGLNEHWEVSSVKDGVTVTARAPYHGQYTRLEVEQRRKHGFVNLTYAYQEKTNTYRLVTSSYQKYGYYSYAFQGAEELVYAGQGNTMCRDQDSKVFAEASDWKAILDRLTNGTKEGGQKLKCVMDYYEKTLFEPSCFNDKFKDSLDDIKGGIVEVLMSVYTKTDPSGSPRATFLQCLNENGLNTHAARIQRKANQLLLDITQALKGGGKMPSLSLSAARFCEEVQKTKLQTPLQNVIRSYKPFTCFTDSSSTDTARYLDGERDQVAFLRPKSQIEMPASNYTNQHAYASFAFHEMLHSSKIANEDLTYSIQWCCGDADRIGMDSPPCQRMHDILEGDKLVDTYETNLGSESPTYWDFRRDEIDKKFGTGIGSTFMKDFFQTLDSSSTADRHTYEKCMASASSESGKKSCLDTYKKKLAQLTKDYFNDPSTCKAFSRYASNPSAINCAQMGDKLASVMSNIQNSLAAPIPARKPVTTQASGDTVKGQSAPGAITPQPVSDSSGSGMASPEENESQDDRSIRGQSAGGAGLTNTQPTGSDNVRDAASDVPPSSEYVGGNQPASNRQAGSYRRSRSNAGSSYRSRNPATTSPVRLRSPQARNDIAYRNDRGTLLLNKAKQAASLIKDAFLPQQAQAATSDMGGGNSTPSRGISYESPLYRALQEQHVDLPGDVSLPNLFDGMADRQYASVKSARFTGGVSASSSSGGRGGSAPPAAQSAQSGTGTPDIPGGKSNVAAAKVESAPESDGGLMPSSQKQAGTRSKQDIASGSDEFKDQRRLVQFITSPYFQKVWPRLNSPEKWSLVEALADPKNRIQIRDHRGDRHGSSRPKIIYTYCESTKRLSRPNDCRKGGG